MELFGKFDQNHDNKITFEEFFEMVNKDRQELTEEQARVAFKEWDTNGDGVIDIKEYWSGVTLKKKSLKDESERAVFRMFDLDGDGFVEKEELITILKADGDDLRNFVETLFKQADADGDGKLNFQEFGVFFELFWNSNSK